MGIPPGRFNPDGALLPNADLGGVSPELFGGDSLLGGLRAGLGIPVGRVLDWAGGAGLARRDPSRGVGEELAEPGAEAIPEGRKLVVLLGTMGSPASSHEIAL